MPTLIGCLIFKERVDLVRYCVFCTAFAAQLRSLRFRFVFVVCCSEPAILNHLFASCKSPCFTAFVAYAACFAAPGSSCLLRTTYCVLLAALLCFHQHRSEIMKEFFTSVKLVKHSSNREFLLLTPLFSSFAALLLPEQIAVRFAFVPSSQ